MGCAEEALDRFGLISWMLFLCLMWGWPMPNGWGPIFVFMLWIQINAFILLVGFELNASIAVNRDLKEKIEDVGEVD